MWTYTYTRHTHKCKINICRLCNGVPKKMPNKQTKQRTKTGRKKYNNSSNDEFLKKGTRNWTVTAAVSGVEATWQRLGEVVEATSPSDFVRRAFKQRVNYLPFSFHVSCSPIGQKNGHVGAAREGLIVDVDGLTVLLPLKAVIGQFLQSVHEC